MANVIGTDSEGYPLGVAALRGRIGAVLGGGEGGGAVLAFAVRIVGAGLGYVLHILLARSLGAAEFGIWASGWTMLLVVGHAASFGFSESVVRFFTTYAARGEWGRGRGFLIFGSFVTLAFSGLVGALSLAILALSAALLPVGWAVPLTFAILAIPFFAFQDWLEGIARSFGRPILALAPIYVLRPCMIAIVLTGAVSAGSRPLAGTAMAATLMALAVAMLVQVILVWRAAPKELFAARSEYGAFQWLGSSAPLAAVFLIDQLAAYADVLALAATAPAGDTGVYFAASRILSLVAMAPYAVSVIAGRSFALHEARGAQGDLHAAIRRTTRWSFFASCALLLVLLPAGPLLLSSFGRDFVSAAPVLTILSLGLVARAAGGHAEELLVALGHQATNAKIALASAVAALGLAFAVTPVFGPLGAAAAMACAAAIRSFLFVCAARRLTGHYTGIGRDTFFGVQQS